MKLFASVVPALVSTVAFAAPGLAAEQLLYGKEPGWVVAAPTAAEVPSGDAPVTILLVDQQIAFDAGRTSIYTESRMRIDKPEGLAAGNLSFSWEPQQQAVTVHKVHIRRAGKIIDVLGGGQSFTVLRRETNLEAAMLDGTLTANLQPEGLRDGDVIELAMTVEHVDDDMKGYRDIQFAMWNGMRIARARARVLWPNGAPFKTQFSAALPAAVKIGPINGREGIELNAGDVQPLLTPRNAPPRFQGELYTLLPRHFRLDLAEKPREKT